MKRLLFIVLVSVWGWHGNGASAQEAGAAPVPKTILPPKEAALEAHPSCPAPQVEKTLSSCKLFLQEHQAATTIPNMVLRDIEACKEVQHSLEVAYHEEKFTCTEITFEEKQVEQEVTCITVKPETSVDPATGKSCTVYKQVPVVKKVQVTVFNPVSKEKTYVARFPYVKPVETNVLVKKLEVDCITVPGIEKTLSVIPAPCEAKVLVPVPPPVCLPK
jgi:hypothetical protein